MKEYLENRIEELKEEYKNALEQVSKQNAENVSNPLWEAVNLAKGALNEVKLIQKFFIENNYTNS